MMRMRCVICGSSIEHPAPARHLPHFARCPNCSGYVTVEKEAATYPAEYFTEELKEPKKSIFSPLFDFFLWMRMKKIMHTLGGKSGKILDYGCGNGKLVAYLRQRGFAVYGYDPEPAAVALAQKWGLPVFGEIPDKKYDVVMFWHSLEHSETPFQDILVLKNHMNAGARLLIAVPNGDSLEAMAFGESFFCYDWPFHRVHFTPKALAILLEKAGFYVLSVDHFNPEYTISSLVQTCLNLFLPKNAFYSLVSKRRQTVSRGKLLFLGSLSLFILIVVSPILILFFIVALFSKKTAAFIVVTESVA